jgi:hypothetical protein
MPHRLMCATALALALGAAAIQFWPESPVEQVATRAEMMAAREQVMPVSAQACLPVVFPRAAAEI